MSTKIKEIFKNSIIVDGMFHDILEDPPPECEIGKNIVDMILEGGVNCMVNSIQYDWYPGSFKDLCHEVYDHFLLQDVLCDKFMIVEKFEDIARAKEEGKLAFIMSTQGSNIFEGDVRNISLCYKLGLRIIQITYNGECAMGSGVYVPQDNGLTYFGRQAIIEMNRIGMVIDVSHVGYRTAMETIEASEAPIIYSHSGVKAVSDHRRNVSDDHIRALTAKGGVLGICPHCIMTTNDTSKRPTVEHFIDAMVHIADISGSMDHAGVGTDRWSRDTLGNEFQRVGVDRIIKGAFANYDSNSKHVEGFNYYNEWENLVDRMLARGFSEADVTKVLGGNFLRVFKEVWK